eukprot:1162136-Pelagomonas_calceolata.AAC.14
MGLMQGLWVARSRLQKRIWPSVRTSNSRRCHEPFGLWLTPCFLTLAQWIQNLVMTEPALSRNMDKPQEAEMQGVWRFGALYRSPAQGQWMKTRSTWLVFKASCRVKVLIQRTIARLLAQLLSWPGFKVLPHSTIARLLAQHLSQALACCRLVGPVLVSLAHLHVHPPPRLADMLLRALAAAFVPTPLPSEFS